RYNKAEKAFLAGLELSPNSQELKDAYSLGFEGIRKRIKVGRFQEKFLETSYKIKLDLC
ncbi:hypothetical protein MKW92_052003, partial [Papaver armeniacum]